MAGSGELERERDALVQSIISLEDQFNRGRAVPKAEYLRQRHELEQRLVQVMDELTRRSAFQG
ncbi:MAG: hypothetical protein JW839_08585 [Candidatus Lokiarchaeota archaeon]|nr:hypothetical protein [Candidatus Lokiarchaeota archaeon]